MSSIVFFDEHCGFCNTIVRFLLKFDRRHVLRFAPLQGQTAKQLLPKEFVETLHTVVFIDQGKRTIKSTAILKIFSRLGGLWRLLGGFMIIPRGFRDGVYSLIARYRTVFFGKIKPGARFKDEDAPFFLP